MNGEIFQVTAQQMEKLAAVPNEVGYAAGLSSHILMGRFNGEILCFIGFIPKAMTSDTAYLWMHCLPAAERHPLLLGRYAKRVLQRGLEVYPILIGHCFSSVSWRWLKSLGAVVISDKEFEFRRA